MRYGDNVIIGSESFHPHNGSLIMVPVGTRGMIVGDAGDDGASVLVNAADLPDQAGGLDAGDAIIITAPWTSLARISDGRVN
ncbi:MAG TPA: hypothetical protein VLO13_03595 [Halomonas sp.]|nr:hypothetical protein [Halomonas sp.]